MSSSPSLNPQGLTLHPAEAQLASGRGAALLPRLGLLVALALLVGLGALQLVPPAVVPASAPATDFSAERAMADLRVIAAAPRGSGTPGHSAARQYLLDQLSALGLAPELQTAPSNVRFPGAETFYAGRVQNVIVRVPGSASSGAILLDAHYDGGHTGPGASDCGACVVTALETLRAILAGPPLMNDLIVVFSDSEEHHDIGAHAFATQHPWAQEVRLALGFEAQGSRGPALLYRTSGENGDLVEAYSATSHPRGSSYFVSLAQLLATSRFGCDLEEYLDIGSAGLGFLYAADTPAYHTLRDSADETDPRSIQHMGANALALVRHFGAHDLRGLPHAPDAVFFNLLPDLMAHCPTTWVLPLNLLITAGALLIVGYGLWRRRIGLGGTFSGALALLLGIPLSVALVVLLWWAVRALTPSYQVILIGSYQTPLNVVGLAMVTIGLLAGLVALLRRRIAPLSLAAAGALAGLVLLWPVSLAMPGASYLLAWPLLFSLLPLALALAAPTLAGRPWVAAALLALAALPGLVLLPLILHINTLFLTRIELLLGLPLLALLALFVAPLVVLLVPQLIFLSGPADRAARRWLVPGVALLLGVALLGWASLRSGFSPAQPRPDMVGYVLDADTGAAQWVSPDQHLDSYTSQFFPAGTQPGEVPAARFLTLVPGPGYAAAAPPTTLEAPQVVLRDEQSTDGVRTLQLHITSLRGATLMDLTATAPGPIIAATVDGQPLDLRDYGPAQAGTLNLSYAWDMGQGFDLTLTVRAAGKVTLAVVELSDGLPQIPGIALPPRPSDTMPAPGVMWDPTVVMRSYDF